MCFVNLYEKNNFKRRDRIAFISLTLSSLHILCKTFVLLHVIVKHKQNDQVKALELTYLSLVIDLLIDTMCQRYRFTYEPNRFTDVHHQQSSLPPCRSAVFYTIVTYSTSITVGQQSINMSSAGNSSVPSPHQFAAERLIHFVQDNLILLC